MLAMMITIVMAMLMMMMMILRSYILHIFCHRYQYHVGNDDLVVGNNCTGNLDDEDNSRAEVEEFFHKMDRDFDGRLSFEVRIVTSFVEWQVVNIIVIVIIAIIVIMITILLIESPCPSLLARLTCFTTSISHANQMCEHVR